MVWAGSPFAHLIDFGTGSPVGAISYQLLGNDGVAVVHSGTVTPDAGAVSSLLVIDAPHNTVATPLFETRTLTWNYTTATGLVSDRVTYRVNRPIPFAVSTVGVRNKLGIATHELTDDMIDLVRAYADLADMIDGLDVVAVSGDRGTLLATDAIEALAGLAVLPSLQLRAGQSEKSGTDAFSRYGEIDWDWLRLELRIHVERAREALDPVYDATGENLQTFGTAPRSPDAVTGA